MAGNIDQLNFEVILDDAKFNAAIQRDLKTAKELNTQLSAVLNMKKKLNGETTQQIVNAEKVRQAELKSAREAAKTATAQEKVRAQMAKTAAAGERSANSFARAWVRVTATFWSIVSVIRIFTRAIGKAIKNISDFQQANANLATIMQVTRKEIETLTNDALMLGRTTEWTASQVTELQTSLAKLGFNIPQIRNMQASVLQFATAVGAKLPDAANLAGASLRMFGMHSTEMQKALEILAASTNKTALDFEKLKVSLPYVGAIAHSIGLDIAETASLLGVLTNAGLESSRAGTGLRQVLLELSKQNGKLQTAMGGNIKSFDDFVNGLQSLRDRGFEAGEATKLVSTRASAALLILANGVDDIRRLNKEVRDTDGLLKEIQSERLNTLHGSTLLLKSAWEGLIQTFRDSAGPMKDVVDWLTKIVQATSLAASRSNRVAQGTKDIIGSDALTKQFKERFDSLLGTGISPEEAANMVQREMQNWLDGAFGTLSDLQKKGYKENGWNEFLYRNPITHFFVSGKTEKGRAANEQVEAMENAMDAVTDYMQNRAKEGAEIAANTYLEQWKAVFDSQGEKAARDAMSKVAGYEDMKTRMEAYIANGGEEGANDRGKGKNTAEERQKNLIKNLKDEATYLRKLADAYDKFEPYLGEGVNEKMVEIFGDGDYSKENLEKQITDITAALRGLGDEGKDAAESIEQAWGLDKVSKSVKQLENAQKYIENQQKTIETARKELEKWEKDWGGQYTGFNGELEKAFSKYTNDDKKIDEEYIAALNDAYEAYKDDTDALKEYTDQLYVYYQARKAANLASGQASIDDLVSKHVKRETSGMSLKDWGDKSIGQVYGIFKALNNLRDAQLSGGLGVDDNLSEQIQNAGFSLEDFAKLSYDEFHKLSKEAKEELLKKLGSVLKEVAGDFKEAASSAKEYAEATGDMDTAQNIDDLMALGDAISNVASRAMQGDWIGAITAGLSFMVKSFYEARIEAAKLEASLRSMQEESRMDKMRDSLSSGVDSIFGTNDIQKVQNAVSAIDKLRRSMKKYANEVDSWSGNTTKKGFWARLFSSPARAATGGSVFNQSSIKEMAKAVGGDLYDAYGNLNADTLQKILDTYENLDTEQREWIQHAIDDSTLYKEAMEQIDSVAESILGSVVSSVADQMVDSWWEAGEAALDYADILGDVAKAYAKLIVQDMLMDAAFDEDRQKAFKDALKGGDAAKAMGIVEEAMQAATDMLPVVNQALEAFEPYRLMSEEAAETNSVGSGIKGITEDTANLLASYINAIRADVSIIRGLQEKHLGAIGESLPTLNDYLAQIAASNYDIARSNQSILAEIQSVIGAPGTSGSVVRVERV